MGPTKILKMKFIDIIKEEESTKCENKIAMAKKIMPLLVDGLISYQHHDSTMKYILKKDLEYRCNVITNDDGSELIHVYPTLHVHVNHPFPFEVYVDDVKMHPNLWTDSTKKESFDHFCDHIDKKCKQFGLHFASKMHS